MNGKIIICADVIARYGDKIVIVERLNSFSGLALPGGKQEHGEFLSETAAREFREETGLALAIGGVLGTFADDGRDPRGRYVSTVFTGSASGDPEGEEKKTRVVFMTKKEILVSGRRFLFDHFEILSEYFDRGG